jgi:hypothetical protein
LLLINQFENVWNREENGHGATECNAKIDKQQKPVNYGGNETPVVSDLLG